MPSILIADDQIDVVRSLRLLLKSVDLVADAAATPNDVLKLLSERRYDLLLMDLNYARDTTSGVEGLKLLDAVRSLPDPPAVVVMTAWGSVELAVEAMRRGARDFVEKPWSNERLLQIIRTQLELGRALRSSLHLEAELRAVRNEAIPDLIASSPAMQPVLNLVGRVAATEAAVLITGENGTGKGLVARALLSGSARAESMFVVVDVASLSETVVESELFGHVKGAFTDARADRIGRIELADGGTLFLDEIANIPLKLQAKLLRVVESGEFEPVGSSRVRRADTRIIAATNADLREEVQAGRFRQDLLFRLNTVEIHLPPLRDRREDIPLLAEHFLRRHAQRHRKPSLQFEEAAMKMMLSHRWPGNVRELSHLVERAVLLSQGDTIRLADLALGSSARPEMRLDELTLEEVERVLIVKAMARYEYNISQAAQALGLSRTALYRRLDKHGLNSTGASEQTE